MELDLDFLGLSCQTLVLVAEEPNVLLDDEHQPKLPGVISWNLTKLVYDLLKNKYGCEVLSYSLVKWK